MRSQCLQLPTKQQHKKLKITTTHPVLQRHLDRLEPLRDAPEFSVPPRLLCIRDITIKTKNQIVVKNFRIVPPLLRISAINFSSIINPIECSGVAISIFINKTICKESRPALAEYWFSALCGMFVFPPPQAHPGPEK